MKKSNLTTLLLTTIATLFLMTGITFADGAWSGTDISGDAYRTGNVGIGTDTPNQKLHVSGGDIELDNNQFLRWRTTEGSEYAVMKMGVDNKVYLRNGGDHFVLDRSGYVGIGTTNPESALHIDKSQDSDYIYIGGASNSLYSAINFRTDETMKAWVFAVGSTYPSWSLTGALNIYNQDGPIAFQTNGGNNRMIINSSGNVGIGTETPAHKFDVFTGLANVKTYNYGLETTVDTSGGWARSIRFRNEYNNVTSAFGALHGEAYISSGFNIDDDATGYKNAHLLVKSNGNVGIGTTSPQSKLAVNGTITSKEVKVTDTGWSDFVFEDDYALPTLNQVESFINENKHLPDIPSAKQVEEEGLSMAEMMAKQMQKIEELTLYVIEQNKKLESQNEKIVSLEKELAELKR